MATLTKQEAHELGKRVGFNLLGTCNYPAAIIEQLGLEQGCEDAEGFAEGLDAVAMCCDMCGWWDEAGNVIINFNTIVCDECQDKDEEE